MNISISEHFQQYIEQKIASGEYLSANDLIRDALQLLEERDQTRKMQIEELKNEIRKGIDSGPATPWDKEKFLQSAKKSLEDKGYKL